MIKAMQEENKLTLKIHSHIGEGFWDEEEKEEGTVQTVEDLEKLIQVNKNASLIDVYINSPGGDVMEGIGIYNILKRSKAYKRVYIDGFACSIASVIAMAGNAIYMPKSSLMMIHNCWTVVCGNANDMRKAADDLDKINQLGISAYMTKFNGTEEKLRELLDGETYLTADECLEYGLCTKIVDDSEDTQEEVSESLEAVTNMYSSQLKNLRSIKAEIAKAENGETETVNEAEQVEIVDEVETFNEASASCTVKADEVAKQAEEVKANALKAFFHVA